MMWSDEWVSFFEILVQTSGAILGFALVTFGFRVKFWLGKPLKVVVAMTTLAELFAPVLFGLISLAPHHHWRIGGYLAGGLGYATIIFHVIQYLRFRKDAGPFDKKQLGGLFVMAGTCATLMLAPQLNIRAYVCVWLIFSGLTETFIYLRPPFSKDFDVKHSARSPRAASGRVTAIRVGNAATPATQPSQASVGQASSGRSQVWSVVVASLVGYLAGRSRSRDSRSRERRE